MVDLNFPFIQQSLKRKACVIVYVHFIRKMLISLCLPLPGQVHLYFKCFVSRKNEITKTICTKSVKLIKIDI